MFRPSSHATNPVEALVFCAYVRWYVWWNRGLCSTERVSLLKSFEISPACLGVRYSVNEKDNVHRDLLTVNLFGGWRIPHLNSSPNRYIGHFQQSSLTIVLVDHITLLWHANESLRLSAFSIGEGDFTGLVVR